MMQALPPQSSLEAFPKLAPQDLPFAPTSISQGGIPSSKTSNSIKEAPSLFMSPKFGSQQRPQRYQRKRALTEEDLPSHHPFSFVPAKKLSGEEEEDADSKKDGRIRVKQLNPNYSSAWILPPLQRVTPLNVHLILNNVVQFAEDERNMLVLRFSKSHSEMIQWTELHGTS